MKLADHYGLDSVATIVYGSNVPQLDFVILADIILRLATKFIRIFWQRSIRYG